MRFFITGATGFIGPHLIDRLTSENHFCRCLLRPGKEAGVLERAGVEIVRSDNKSRGGCTKRRKLMIINMLLPQNR